MEINDNILKFIIRVLREEKSSEILNWFVYHSDGQNYFGQFYYLAFRESYLKNSGISDSNIDGLQDSLMRLEYNKRFKSAEISFDKKLTIEQIKYLFHYSSYDLIRQNALFRLKRLLSPDDYKEIVLKCFFKGYGDFIFNELSNLNSLTNHEKECYLLEALEDGRNKEYKYFILDNLVSIVGHESIGQLKSILFNKDEKFNVRQMALKALLNIANSNGMDDIPDAYFNRFGSTTDPRFVSSKTVPYFISKTKLGLLKSHPLLIQGIQNITRRRFLDLELRYWEWIYQTPDSERYNADNDDLPF